MAIAIRATCGGLLVATTVVAVGCGTSGAAALPAGTSPTVSAAVQAPPAVPPTRTAAHRVVDPGTLPQTGAKPGVGAVFERHMRVLWSAITRGAPAVARPVFFPESAYRQVKAIWNPNGDFSTRIWANFVRDIAAYHRYLGRHAAAARLTGVIPAPAAATWVPRGVCENGVGYWQLPGTRLVYDIGSTRHSVGVYSMISWRGVWYPIPLGDNTPPASPGTVDDPQTGTGIPGVGPGC